MIEIFSWEFIGELSNELWDEVVVIANDNMIINVYNEVDHDFVPWLHEEEGVWLTGVKIELNKKFALRNLQTWVGWVVSAKSSD